MGDSNFKRVSVIGLGYIGLPTAAVFASYGTEVVGIDVDEQIVDTINRGEIHIVEAGLESAVQTAVQTGKLSASLTPQSADAFLIAVPTPLKGIEKKPDISYVEQASLAIAPVLEPGNIVILESTSPIGTTEQMAAWLAEARPDLTFPQSHGDEADIHIAHCPERVLPGAVMRELISNDRIIGGMSARCSKIAKDLYSIFVAGDCVIASSPREAEMAKLTENSFRDVSIAFANELSLICDRLDIDVWELIALANRHPRVNILQPGPGVGGHCIAVDPWFLVASAPEQAQLISTARTINDGKPIYVVKKALEAITGLGQDGKAGVGTIACYGLAFKPDIDDLRESPAVQITKSLSELFDGRVLAVEPYIDRLPAELGDTVQLVDFATAQSEADLHIMLVDHSQFKQSEAPKGAIIDTRGVWQ